MSKRPRRKFETGFKKQLVAQIAAGQITATEAARVHSISPTVISYWRKQFQAGELSEGPTRREKALLKEMEQYKKLLAEAHREIDCMPYTNQVSLFLSLNIVQHSPSVPLLFNIGTLR